MYLHTEYVEVCELRNLKNKTIWALSSAKVKVPILETMQVLQIFNV